MIINARINGEGGTTFKLCEWNATSFSASPVLMLQTDDLQLVKQTFEHISKIEIFVSDNPVAMYTKYDTYGAIGYNGRVFVQHENVFADCMRVELIRSSLEDEVERLNEIINQVVDVDAMTAEEYKDYLLLTIGAQCRADIYAGTQVTLTDGTVETYTYNDDDQKNLTNAMAILIICPELELIPYHPSGGFCRMIPAMDLLTIYGTLQLRLTYLTTRCNFMNMWIRSMHTKEELLEISWNTELPESYQEQVTSIYSQSLTIFNKIKEKFSGPTEEVTEES